MSINKLMDKHFKYETLRSSAGLLDHQPETVLFTKENLFTMLDRHREIMVKPINSSGGKGIRKVTKLDDGKFRINRGKKTLIIQDEHSLFDHFIKAEKKGKKSFIIQHYISLAKVDGRPIDFRYIVQRKKGTMEWTITGKHAKVANEGCFVTNLQQGAEVIPVEDALEKSNINNVTLAETLKVLDHVALSAVECLTMEFNDHTIWGFDLGADENGHVWIIEANAFPLIGGFRFLEDLSMYETMMSIINANQEIYTSKGWRNSRGRL